MGSAEKLVEGPSRIESAKLDDIPEEIADPAARLSANSGRFGRSAPSSNGRSEAFQEQVAQQYGFRLTGRKMEQYDS